MTDGEFLEIVKSAMQGDEQSFIELCEIKGKDILYLTRSILQEQGDAEEAVQEIFLYMQQHITQLKNENAYILWMYRVIKGVCFNINRKRKRRIPPVIEYDIEVLEGKEESIPYEFLEDRRKREIILDEINELPNKYKLCGLMFYYQGTSYKGIQKALGLTNKQVDNALSRARKKLKKRFNEEGYDTQLLSGVVAAPAAVLAGLLREDIQKQIAVEEIQPLIANSVGRTSAHIAASGSAAKAAGLGTSVKAGIGIAVISAAGVVAVTAWQPPQEPAASSEMREFNQTLPEPMDESPEEEVDDSIRTLGDMIGEPEAEYLISITNQEVDGKDEADHFLLNDIGMILQEAILNPDSREEYALFQLEKQDKLLMVITRYEAAVDIFEAAYLFTETGTVLPEDTEMIFRFEEWKSTQ